MTQHEFLPIIKPIRQGQNARIQLDVQNVGDLADRDWTGATISVEFVPESGTAVTKAGALDGDPTTGPQGYVDILPATFAALTAPQTIKAYATVMLAGGKVDLPAFQFELLEGGS